MFSLSYVVVTVKSRLAGMDPTLEKAAQDLYATPPQTFMGSPCPLVAPGIAGRRAALLRAVGRRLHHHVLTAGNEVTFPMYVYALVQRSVPAQIDVHRFDDAD